MNFKLVTRSYSSAENPEKAIIGLHGWTGDEHVFEPVAKMMNINDAKWFFPRAPYKADSGTGFSWFSGTDETGWEIEKTRDGIHQLLEEIKLEGFPPENIFLIGFSQGASLAMEIGLRLPYAIGGIIPIAGFIKFIDVLENESTEESKGTPILLLHGNQDEIIYVKASEKAHDYFKERGNSVHFERYDAGHKIPRRTGPIVRKFISNPFNFLKVNASNTLN
ncbi:MAG: dienelactone hydrolase family protein [Candidatus Marinimicrobia bacterium]|nr:dienelactone hydrolase family protein [Candidatus Neomarinimicrobiota bacterium]MBL7010198.1 dienelactone hydrolase family protein [Candidatus Neomarinimicrobiota bacterium]MBL7030611.1 dienelactone hydrolase family protein [Candidatus Neomarinimicrobiota bacterium]